MKRKDALTDRQRRFVGEYARDLNATQAAIRTGYSPRTANEQGARLLAKASVSTAVAKITGAALQKSEVDVAWIIREYVEVIGRSKANMADFVNDAGSFKGFDKLTRAQTAAIAEYIVDETGGGSGDGERKRVQRTRIKLHGLQHVTESLRDLGKHLKMFTEKVEIGFDDELTAAILEGRARVAAAIQIG